MEWIFENFNAELEELDKPVRDKAIAIAIELLNNEDITEDDAIKRGIVEAKE